MIIEAKGISKGYVLGNKKIPIIDKLDFYVNEGEKVAIIGPSGSGKSTLLNILGGLDSLDEGSILFEGEDISRLKGKELAKVRGGNFGFIFQEFCLVNTLNAIDNVLVSLYACGKTPDMDEVYKICRELGIDERLEHYPHQLSGGEKQRVAIARAIVCKPKVIFSDEATGNLDQKNSKVVMEMLVECCKKYNISLVYVTHDLGLVEYADRVLDLGKL